MQAVAEQLNRSTVAELDDRELMKRFQAGDEFCFEVLVDRHKQRVMNLVWRFMQGSDEAEDVAQEIFIRVYKAKDSYKPTAQFTTWLHTICRNTCYNALARRARRPVLLKDDDEEHADTIQRLPDFGNPTPEKSMMYQELAEAVKQGVDALPDNQREAFILARYEHCSYEEIARRMACSAKAVKSLLNRAKTNLREQLKKVV
ncbi:RNA polymerase sigma factor [Pontiella sp.]|uniref:RNA polymerase sigma factor n=1 Tax=Pontiella sp. TaxID=2837462 RepID=UPI00356A3360